ncbi:putative bifunctional diguanylate cyclase/phosphodiesterase [Xanthobacter sp. AM11]|uniref:putative bifunctional diguanylate cyclase/phosphodiesterase n=1 Tax=Xanthobacter sp. AM11 TaxID=3380643 RepID=UPI0039BFFD2B
MTTPQGRDSGRNEARRPGGLGPVPLAILTVLLIAVVVGVAAALVEGLRQDGMADRRRELQNLALTIAEQTARAFQGLQIIQNDIIDHMEELQIEDRTQLAAGMGGKAIHDMMRDKISGLPFLDAITLVDATGRLVNFSRYWPIPEVNVADRDYFKVLKAMDGPPLFVSEPVPNRGTGTATIYLAQRLTTPDGRFLGLVLGAMEQAYFERFYGTIRLSADGQIALVRRDGALLARFPGSAGTAHQDAAVRARIAAEIFKPAFAEAVPAGVLDEKARIAAVQPIGNLPVAVVVSESAGAVSRQMWERVLPILLTAGLLCLTIALVSFGLGRHMLRSRAFAETQHAMARTDPLTGLANRLGFADEMERHVAAPGEPAAFALLFLDLDYFKSVNDTLGHDVGDSMLVEVAQRLRRRLRASDTVARFGGDEFAILHLGPNSDSDVIDFARGIIETLQEPFFLGDHRVVGSCSVGIALCPKDGVQVAGLLKSADLALYRAKSDGRGVARMFQEEMERSARERRLLELDLHAAWKGHQFFLAYQPIFEARSGRLAGFEALARWHHPQRGLVPPDVFIPLAEETGLIFPLGAWVLMEACRAAAQWPDPIFISINLSALQFRGGQALHQVRSALDASGLRPDRLEIEITESTLLQEGPVVRATLQQFREEGITVALDDFGTGYSSLRYLRMLSIGRIKVDRTFVEQIETSPESLAITRAIVSLAGTLSLRCTAEGIETEGQRKIMVEEGCTHLQGYLLGRPGTAEEALMRTMAVA